MTRVSAGEKWELENYEEGEKKEMVELFEYKGLRRPDAESVIGAAQRPTTVCRFGIFSC